MQKRSLGLSPLEVTGVGLGCMGMSEFYGATDEKEAIATLHKAVELGINFFDTADMYGSGENEKLVAKGLKPYRDQVIIATKFGFVRDPNNPNARAINGSKAYVKKACEASLQRLEQEVIDLYYLHRVDPNTPVEETVTAMAELVQEGKVKYIGLSEVSAETIKKAYQIHPITAVQSEYSLWNREPEQNIIPICENLGISFVAYSPLGRGFLTGKMAAMNSLEQDDFRRQLPRFQEENFANNLKLVAALETLATTKNCTAAQLALAWVLAKSPRTLTIPGTKRQKYLIENAGADAVHLSVDDMHKIDELLQQYNIAGDRYTTAGMALIEK